MDYADYRQALQDRFTAPELAFPRDEYAARQARVREAMATQGLDLLMFSEPSVLCYLTGYTTFEVSVQCVLLVSPETTVLFVPAIEIGPAVYLSCAEEVIGYAWESPATVAQMLATRMKKLLGGERPSIGFSPWSPTLSSGLLDAVRAALGSARFCDMGDLLDRIRLVKSADELTYLRESAVITGAGLDAAAQVIEPGVLDHQIAQAGADTMLGMGSEFMSMQPIVTTGFRSGIIHTNHAGHRVEPGDVVFTEFGAVRRRYTAPMMRTAVLGRASDDIRAFHTVCLEVLDAVMHAARSGEPFSAAARAGEQALAPIADKAFFSGVYGYPVGAQFPPSWVAGSTFIARDCDAMFTDDMVFHLPICLRKPGKFGVGFSETIRVTEHGAERLTANDLSLQVVR